MKKLITVNVLTSSIIRDSLYLFLTCLLVIGTTGIVHAYGGIEGTFEYAFDAPWRMEPYLRPDGQIEYGTIPIQISIHDAVHAVLDEALWYGLDEAGWERQFGPDPRLPSEFFGLGNFCQITVYAHYSEDIPPEERGCKLCMWTDTDPGTGTKIEYECGGSMSCPECEARRELLSEWGLKVECVPDERSTITRRFSATYLLEDLAEIEMTKGDWVFPLTDANEPEYDICRSWDGEDCESFRDISQTSEWHALLWYEPPQYPKPGSVISLKVEMKLTRQPWISCNGEISGDHPQLDEDDMIITLRNYLKVYLGDEPLPRFDNNCLYGDLHFHGQGSANEGEFCANYRGVVRAMGAMGLDFLFATEHASSSERIIDADFFVEYEKDLHDIELERGQLVS